VGLETHNFTKNVYAVFALSSFVEENSETSHRTVAGIAVKRPQKATETQVTHGSRVY